MADVLPTGEELSRFLAQRSDDVAWTADEQGVLRYVTPNIERLIGSAATGVLGRSLESLISDAPEAEAVRHTLFARGDSWNLTYALNASNGARVWVDAAEHAVRSPDGRCIGLAGVWHDVTERRRIEEAFEHQTYHDQLTGLPNRRLFDDRLTIALANARRLDARLAILLFDIDRLTTINDALGHKAGDEVLREVGRRLESRLRANDTLARVGTDEFALAISNLRHEEDALRLARSLLANITAGITIENRELFVTASIGVAIFPHDGETSARLLPAADDALHEAKRAGGNTYRLHHSSVSDRALERLATEMDLHRAIAQSQFVLLYQPLITLAKQHMVAVEALIRWSHPERGEMLPGAFLDVAEQTGLIMPIGEQTLQLVCAQTRDWLQQGWRDVSVAVNLSARQFEHPDLLRHIDDALRNYELPASVLQLEITERTALHDLSRTKQLLHDARTRGMRVAIDDFGIGYSSLAYLKELPLDALKIDKAFLNDLPDRRDAAIVEAIIAMAHALGLDVIAEGVEREEQLDFLRAHGCDAWQGYLFSRPTTASEISRLRPLG